MRRLFIIQALLIVAVGTVHVLALKLYLYWLFPWLDVFVHFFGALWIALIALWIFKRFGLRISFFRVFTVVGIVSIGWELFELWGGIPREANFAFDTSVDLLMDVLGGVVGFFAGERLITRDTMAAHGEIEGDPS